MSASTVVVRRARPADDDPLQALDVATYSPHVSPAGPPSEGDRFFARATRPEDVLVAERDGVMVGYVALRPPTSLPSNAHVLQIVGLAVDPALQGTGIGRRLLDASISEAGRRGARRLTLRVFAGNAPARALYESCGFTLEGVLRGEFLRGGEYVDDVLMALDLVRDA